MAQEELELNPEGWYAERRISRIHDRVTRIGPGKKQLKLMSGRDKDYTKLILAVGSNPFVPTIPGSNLDGVTTLRTLSQAREIIARVKPQASCVCIGGGLLGIELAAGLRKRGANVTVLEGFGWLLPRQLAPKAGAVLKSKIESMGIRVLCGAKVAAIQGSTHATGVVLESGEVLVADLVLISAGVRPNITLALEAGLTVDKGLRVDDRMQTSDPSIFAAGDVTEHGGTVYGLWHAAMEQGRVAGANAAGGSEIFKGMAPSAFLKVVGLDVFSIGDFMPKDPEARTVEKVSGDSYSLLAVRDGILIGANLVGDISAAMAAKAAVTKGQPVKDNARLLKMFPELESEMKVTE
jgi:nitrite reductase (NADH) large subunit